MEMAMTTFARGVPALKRAVGAFIPSASRAMDWRQPVEAELAGQRSVTAASAQERRAARAEYAWIDAAAGASLHLRLG
jgi:hypothetical protein